MKCKMELNNLPMINQEIIWPTQIKKQSITNQTFFTPIIILNWPYRTTT